MAATTSTIFRQIPSFQTTLFLAVALRIGLIFYGAYQDAHSSLKYTDVDYRVFSDATKAILQLHGTNGGVAEGWLVKWTGWNIVGE